MGYKIFIPTAGMGTRVADLTKGKNKSLITVAGKPVISHIVESYPKDSEFVIALGHTGELVRDFLLISYPNLSFQFVYVDKYIGSGAGLGYSMLVCKEYLQTPFIFHACDTIVEQSIPEVSCNWMGYSNITSHIDIQDYRTVTVVHDMVHAILEKGSSNPNDDKPYIGLCGIYDFKTFWAIMESDLEQATQIGEVFALTAMLSLGINAVHFTWHDTGNPESVLSCRKKMMKPDEPVVLEKPNEDIWFVNNKVIKYSDDEDFITNRVLRAGKIKIHMPCIVGHYKHFFSYRYVSGHVFSNIVTIPLFHKLLDASLAFWSVVPAVDIDEEAFRKTCIRFYKDKTYERLEQFYHRYNKSDNTLPINGKHVTMLCDYLHDIDWNWLAAGRAGNFHGDFHFENIIYDEKTDRFTFLDWRQDFGGIIDYGDIYYDLAKLLHGLIISHEIIHNNQYNVSWNSDEIQFSFDRRAMLVACEKDFYEFLTENHFDIRKVKVLTALIFLNIAALHHEPYSLLLYNLGKEILHETL